MSNHSALVLAKVVFGLLLVSAALVVGSIALVNSTWAVPRIEDALSTVAGRDVHIGNVEFTVGRTLVLQITKLQVANPRWAIDPELAKVELIEIGVDTLALLSGRILLRHLVADQPELHLERDHSGIANWTFGSEKTAKQQAANDDKSRQLELPRIDVLRMSNGTISFVDSLTDTVLSARFNANAGRALNDGAIELRGEGRLFDQALNFHVLSGSPLAVASGADGYPLDVSISSGMDMLQLSGEIDAPLDPRAASLALELHGNSTAVWSKRFALPLSLDGPYRLSALIELNNERLALQDINIELGKSVLTGMINLAPASRAGKIDAKLISALVDLDQILTLMPATENQQSLGDRLLPFVALLADGERRASFDYRIEEMIFDDQKHGGGAISIELDANRLVADVHMPANNAALLTANAAFAATNTSLAGDIKLAIAETELGDIATLAPVKLALDPGARVAAAVDIGFETTFEAAASQNSPGDNGSRSTLVWRALALKTFAVRYSDLKSRTKIETKTMLDSVAAGTLIVADGEIRGVPLALRLQLPELTELISTKSTEPVAAEVDLLFGDSVINAEVLTGLGTVGQEFEIDFSATSTHPSLDAAAFDVDLPKLGAVTVAGHVAKNKRQWIFSNVEATAAGSDMRGDFSILANDETTQIDAQLRSNMFDVDRLLAAWAENEPGPRAAVANRKVDDEEPLALARYDGSATMHIDRLTMSTYNAGDLDIVLQFADGQITLVPVVIELGGGALSAAAQIDATNSDVSGQLTFDIERIDLDEALQRFDIEVVNLGMLDGDIKLRLVESNGPSGAYSNTVLDRLRVEQFLIRYDDPDADTRSDLRVSTQRIDDEIVVEGNVEFRGRVVDVSLKTGTVRDAVDDLRSMPLVGTISSAQTEVRIETTIAELTPIENLRAALFVSGPDPAQFGDLLGIALPHLPPYRLQLDVHRNPAEGNLDRWDLRSLDGRIGDSDLGGDLMVNLEGARPQVSGELNSSVLDFDDVGVIIGAPPDPTETASAEQKTRANRLTASPRVLPRKQMDFSALDALDASIRYRARRIDAPSLPFDDLSVRIEIDNGRLSVDDLAFGVASGTALMAIEIDSHASPTRAKITMDFNQLKLAEILAQAELADDSFGAIGGRLELWMRGESIAQWLGSADGGAYFTVTGGRIDALLVELAGLDFVESTAVFIGVDTGVPIECAYADLQARAGIVDLDPLLLDTTDTKFKGKGTFDLREEVIDIVVNPYPQDFSLLSSRGPLFVEGTFKRPRYRVEPSFPFPEFGSAEDSKRCNGLIEGLRAARKNTPPAAFD